MTRLNLGGGLGVRYRDETPPDVEAYGALVERIRPRLGVTLVIEPGRWLVAPAGVLLTRVVTIKQAGARCWAIVDAAMNDLMRPALYDAWHGIDPVAEPAPGVGTVETDVAGPVCESGDVLGRGRALPPLAAGDLLAVRDVGAYGSVMASTYNGRPLPAEVMVRGDALASIRPRQDHEALLARDLVAALARLSADPPRRAAPARLSHHGHGLRRAQAFDPPGSGPKSVSGNTVEARDAAGGRLAATRRAALSGRQRASRRLPDAPHRAARRSYSVGRTEPRRT